MFQLKVKGTSFHLSNTALGDDKKWCLLVGGIIFWKWGPNATLWSWPPFLNSHFWPMAHPKLWSQTISLARAVHLQSPTIAAEQKLNLIEWSLPYDQWTFHLIGVPTNQMVKISGSMQLLVIRRNYFFITYGSISISVKHPLKVSLQITFLFFVSLSSFGASLHWSQLQGWQCQIASGPHHHISKILKQLQVMWMGTPFEEPWALQSVAWFDKLEDAHLSICA